MKWIGLQTLPSVCVTLTHPTRTRPGDLADMHNLLALALFAAVSLLVLASLSLGLWVITRWQQGLPAIPYSPRRQVPWHAGHVSLVIVVYILSISCAVSTVRAILPAKLLEPSPVTEAGEATLHPLVQLFNDGNVWLLAVGFLAAVVVAPPVEEFLFRVVLQGWFESAWLRLRRSAPILRWFGPRSVVPIVTVALLFATMHYRRQPSVTYHVEYMAWIFIAQAIASLFTMGVAIALLCSFAGATAADLGWNARRLAGDVGMGVLTFAGIAGPLYGLMIALQLLMKGTGIAPDPIPLFFFALLLGTFYHRTHRIAPSLAIHLSLNLTSVLLLLAGAK
jgi:membrane protease YdiL (CAAX protease family)